MSAISAGRRFERFCADFLVQTKGRWAGRALELEPWQRRLAAELLRTDNGVRRYREALIGLPRKNGKSTLCSALALYLLVADGEPGAEVYAAAASRDQARIVFGQAREMVLASPRLQDWCTVQRDAIIVPGTRSVFRVLAADAPRQHGLNPSAVVIDELHAHRDGGDLYYALRTGSLAREQPLVVSITTAGADLETICGQLYEQGQAGAREDLFFHWLGVPDGQIDDPKAWKRANPASWVTIEDLAREARALPRFAFDRFHLNRWTSAEEGWLPAGAWEACEGPGRLEPGDVIYAGVDIGLKHDASALVLVSPKDGRLVVEGHVWAVPGDPGRPLPAHTVVEGDRVELGLIEEAIRQAARRYSLREVAYDPWRFERSAQALADEGLMMLEFPQTNERMAPASQALFDAISEARIVHSGDPVLRAHMDAAVARDTGRGWRLSKKHSRRPMDAAIALALAVNRAERIEPEMVPLFASV